MFGSSTLDVAIGLIFVFLLISLVCTAVNELIAAATRARAKFLVDGIRNMLNGSTELTEKGGKNIDWADRLFHHPLIRGLCRDQDKGPSYIPSQTFALALVDLVRAVKPLDQTLHTVDFKHLRDSVDGIQEEHLRRALQALMLEASSDAAAVATGLKKTEDQIEIWFNEAMERVGGWYKRKTQLVVMIIAVVTTVLLNVDAIQIGRALAKDSTLRASVSAMAQKFAQQPPVVVATEAATRPTTPVTQEEWKRATQNLAESVDRLEGVGLPIGWDSRPDEANGGKTYDPRRIPSFKERFSREWWEWWAQKFFGLLLTALAASLGAPFWFDTLNRIISIRGAGKDPGEKQKDPGKVPGPRRPEDTPSFKQPASGGKQPDKTDD